jgi:hypothetical protein
MGNYGNDKWVEHNKKEFGVQIIALKKIIEEQVRVGTKSDGFTSDMLVAMQSGRKITPKMESAINNIIKRNTPEELYKRDDWVARVVPKIVMVRNMIDETNWTVGYRDETIKFLDLACLITLSRNLIVSSL